MEHRALGKGLSALIPDKVELDSNSQNASSVSYVKTSLIQNNALQPRTKYDEVKLAELKASIKEKGVLQPILVRPVDKGYEVVAGERRLRAARDLNLDEIPVVIRDVSPQESLVLALVENIQREELNPIEEAHAFERLAGEFSLTQDNIAQAVGKDRSTISNTLRLLKLPSEIQDSVSSGEISMGHARALLSLSDEKEQQDIFKTTMKKSLSVRELENLIKARQEGGASHKKIKSGQRNHELVALEEELQQILGTKVRIQAKKKRGKVVIEYYSLDDLDRLLKIIKKA
jgi:ParB family transcriptional regulator, chromosome partitioning protein